MSAGATNLKEAGDFSSALAAATSAEERAEVWTSYLEQHRETFDDDARIAAEYLRAGDLGGLAEHASKYAPERAAAAASALRSDDD